MLKYSKSALGLLGSQYRSVLKKCMLLNFGLMILALPAQAAETELGDLIASVDGTSNNVHTADAWGSGNDFTDPVSQQLADKIMAESEVNPEETKSALTALAPSDAPITQEVTLNANNRMFTAVGNHLRNDNMSVKNNMISKKLDNGISVWADGYYGYSKLKSHGNRNGFSADSWGAVIGMDKQIGHSSKIGAGYQFDHTKVDGYHRDNKVYTNTGFIYGEYKPTAWFVNAIAAYNHGSYHEKKRLLGDTYKDRYHADTFGMQALTGYEYLGKYVDLTPQMGLRYNYIRRHGYVDTAGQNVSGKNIDTFTGLFGVKISDDLYGIDCLPMRPEMYLGMTYDFVSNRDNAIVGLTNGSSYVINGRRLDRFGYEVGAGVTMDFTEKLAMNLNYLGGFRAHYQNHTALLGMKYDF